MSDEETSGALRGALRSVTPPYLPRGEGSMDAIGWTIFLGIVVLFLPLLPVVVIVWLISKAVGALAGRATVDTDDADLE